MLYWFTFILALGESPGKCLETGHPLSSPGMEM